MQRRPFRDVFFYPYKKNQMQKLLHTLYSNHINTVPDGGVPDGWVVETVLKRTSSPAATVVDVVPTGNRPTFNVPLDMFAALVVSTFGTSPRPTSLLVTVTFAESA